MKSKLFLIFVVLISAFSNFLFGEKYKKISDKNFLWKIQGSKSCVYLLGSVHMMPKSIYPLHKNINKAYDDCDFLVVEADVVGLNVSKIQNLIMTRGLYQGNKTLKDDLSDKQYSRLKNFLDKDPLLSIDQVKRMKPWFAAMTVAQTKSLKMGLNSSSGIDFNFLTKAHKDNKKILELESAEFQINLLSRLKTKLQVNFLEASLEDFKDEKEKLNKTITAWLNGDFEELNTIVVKDSFQDKGLEPLKKILFDDRNKNMTRKILRYLKDSTGRNYLVIVGAGHIVGKTGILESLQKEGYKTIQL